MPKGTPNMPRYRLTERAYIDDTLLEPDTEIDFDGIPGPHMDPLNKAAELRVKQYSKLWFDPIRSLEISPTKKELISTENLGAIVGH